MMSKAEMSKEMDDGMKPMPMDKKPIKEIIAEGHANKRKPTRDTRRRG